MQVSAVGAMHDMLDVLPDREKHYAGETLTVTRRRYTKQATPPKASKITVLAIGIAQLRALTAAVPI